MTAYQIVALFFKMACVYIYHDVFPICYLVAFFLDIDRNFHVTEDSSGSISTTFSLYIFLTSSTLSYCDVIQ